MRPIKRHSLYRTVFALGIALPSFFGILAVQSKSAPNEPETNSALQAGPTFSIISAQATGTPPLSTPTSTSAPEDRLLPSPSALISGLYAFIQAPSEPVAAPYVILTATASSPQSVPLVIRGFINSDEFICPQARCFVPLTSSSRLVFAAYTETGQSSEPVIASVSVRQVAEGYLVTIDSVSQFTTFSNACSLAWGVYDAQNVTWDDFVQFPHELNTRKTLHALATQLLLKGIVDASDCPAGGLSLSLDWPTACGLERATEQMIAWQNQYDTHIWLASRQHGVPPKIIKTLIEIETQFWPGNSRFYLDEYGLGQVSQLGIDVLLRKDPTLFQRVCPTVLADCARSYQSLSPDQQAMIRGAAVSLMDVTCTDCQYGVDLDKAKESVSLLTALFKANCEQVDAIVNIVVKPDEDADAATATAAVATQAAGGDEGVTTYEDLWRFTFLAYHSGLNCLQEAVIATKKAKEPVTWENVEERLRCRGGADYVDGFMANLAAFDFYTYQAANEDLPLAAPTIIPTRTPIPTLTPFVSNARVRVQVFMDRNGNRSPDAGEWIDAMTVLLETSTGEQITQRTQDGIALFDMSRFAPGTGVNVSLPGFYRNERFDLPPEGEITVTFMFEQPPLPTVIP